MPGHEPPVSWHAVFPGLPFRDRVSHQIQRHLLSSLPAARAIQQCASWRTDYYGHSVAIGLAPRRRSHVHQRCMCQRDLGVPFVSFNARTGHRSSTPEDCGRFVVTLPQGPVPVSGVFPAGGMFAPSGDWASGNPAFAISRGSPGAPLATPGHDRRFPGMLFFPFHLSDPGSAIRSRDLSSRPCPLRGRYNAAPRGAATTPRGRIVRCGRRARHHRFPRRSMAGSAVDLLGGLLNEYEATA
jgi:hypothetical protein